MGYSGAWGKLIHEKTWNRKSRENCPFKEYLISLNKVGGGLVTVVVRLLAMAAVWVRIQTSQKYKMSNLSIGVAYTLYPAKKCKKYG